MLKEEKKTILFIYRGLPTGGVETLILRKSKWLIKNNYKVFLVVSKYGQMHSQFESEGINLIIDESVLYKPNQVLYSDFLNLLSNIMSSINNFDDIKVIECFEPIDCYYGILLSKILNTKFITGIYHPSAYCSNFDLLKNESAKNLLLLLDRSKSIYYMDEDVIKSHEAFYKIKLENKIILNLPVFIKDRNVLNDRKSCFQVITIGRLVNFKKYFMGLIKDFNEFFMEYPNSKLIIIGDGPEKKRLKKYASKYKSYQMGKIELLGSVQYNEIDKYIKQSSIGIGMGTSLLEMASTGLPSIIAPAYSDSNLANGYIFEHDNLGEKKNDCIKTFKDYMDSLYKCDNDEYISIGDMCRKTVIDYYSIDYIMSKWFNIVDECKPISLEMPLDRFNEMPILKYFMFIIKKKLKQRKD